MNDNHLMAVLALLLAVPAMIWTVRDFRAGKARQLLFASRRARIEIFRAQDPKRFWRFTITNFAVCCVILVFAVMLFFKPVE